MIQASIFCGKGRGRQGGGSCCGTVMVECGSALGMVHGLKDLLPSRRFTYSINEIGKYSGG